MNQRRQRPIPVTSAERERLEQYKRDYENTTGSGGADWGAFLRGAILLGLGAAGVYALSKLVRRQKSTATICCGGCDKEFLLAIPEGVNDAVQVSCPHCNLDLVISLVEGREISE